MKLVSACLLGAKCRYSGQAKSDNRMVELDKKEELVPVCPEQLAGLPTPREPVEIQGGGEAVLAGRGRVVTKSGRDVTQEFIKGAQETLKVAKIFEAKEAILKQKSPSCGCGKIYDGTFSGQLTKGDGVTTALLKQNGIRCVSEEDIN
ncbi:MAG: DUF523 domain-containing protein [Patescibacteria group bacterium]|nr:DUF523 domain-containing protein [Patescibacteria group bacterium]